MYCRHYFRLALPAPSEHGRHRLLERLLSDAGAPCEIDDWRGSVLRGAAESAAAVSLANQLLIAGSHRESLPRAAWVFLASPLHVIASMTSVHLPANGLLCLDSAAAQALAEDFSRVFAGSGWSIHAGAGRLYLLSERRIDARTFDPQLACGGEIQPWLAQGSQAQLLRALGSEIEMWLFAHPVNAARKSAGLDPVTALWPWAHGALDFAAKAPRLKLIGHDPLLAECLPDQLAAHWSVYAGSPPDHDQLAHAARALRGGTGASMKLSCGPIEYTVRHFSRASSWRRLRPWWQYFDRSETG